jgi:hypothetical protein
MDEPKITYCPPGYAIGYGRESHSEIDALAEDIARLVICAVHTNGEAIQRYEQSGRWKKK